MNPDDNENGKVRLDRKKATVAEIMRAAKSVVTDRLRKRQDHFSATGNSTDPSRQRLVQALEDETNLFIKGIMPDETLSSVFRVVPDEIGLRDSTAWKNNGFQNHIETFSYDLMRALEKAVPKDQWRDAHRQLGQPKNEEQFLDAIMALRFTEMLDLFAPAVADRR